MADLGAIGDLSRQPVVQIGYEIRGTGTDRLGNPADRTVMVLARPPAVEVERTTRSLDGTFLVYVPTTQPRTVLVYDSDTSNQNAIVFDRVVPV